MKLNQLSTYTINQTLRSLTLQKQQMLVDVQTEVVTGQVADKGLHLGNTISTHVRIGEQISQLDQFTVTNGTLATRLSLMQDAMSAITDEANSFTGQVIAKMGDPLDRSLLVSIGQGMLSGLHSTLNTTFKGEHIFSGINTDGIALVDYEGANGAAARQAVSDAFLAHFGFAKTDPAAASILPADMEAFLDGPFADLFNDANWASLWSDASDRGMRSRVSGREIIETPVTANDAPFRKAVAAAVSISEFGDIELSGDTVVRLSEHAVKAMAGAIGEVAARQSALGVVENRIENASERNAVQKSVLMAESDNLVGVDSYEAVTRMNEILLSLEASYEATSRVQALSLMNYV